MTLTHENLDAMQCASPDCDHTAHDSGMYLHSKCHAGAPAFVRYEDRVLYLECSICGKLIGAVEVA